MFSTIKITESAFFVGGGYDVKVVVDTAVGISPKTPVEIAGIQVGQVKSVALAEDGRRANLIIRINDRHVQLPPGSVANVRAKGFLGDTYIEISPGASKGEPIGAGGELQYGGVGGDINMMIVRFNEIADDVKVITSSLRQMIAEKDAPIPDTVNNFHEFSNTMKELAAQNQHNINELTKNFAVVSRELRALLTDGRPDAEAVLSNLANISSKVDKGKGTVGRLVNDESTVNKLNDTLDSFNDALGGLQKLEVNLGYHSEYLGASKDFKNYIHFDLWPRPDEAFLFELVEDQSPSADRVTRNTTISTGGTSTTVSSDINTIEHNRFRVSAQLAKKLYDFTLRGGLIESRGGVGIDYNRGAFGVSFSAFDFNTDQGSKPHLKASGTLNITPSIYLLGGADDMLNPLQNTDWFVGAGIRFQDDDIKSLLSAGGLSAAMKR